MKFFQDLSLINGRAVFSPKYNTLSYDIHFLEQTCTEQIPDTRSACHKPKISNILDGRLMLRSFSRKFQPKTDVGLRFEVVQSYSGRYGLNKLSLTMYTSLSSNLALFIFAPFL